MIAFLLPAKTTFIFLFLIPHSSLGEALTLNLYIKVSDIQGVLLNELAARLHHITHKR